VTLFQHNDIITLTCKDQSDPREKVTLTPTNSLTNLKPGVWKYLDDASTA